MPLETLAITLLAFAIVAMLYSSVGHGGASGYLAVMGLVGMSAKVMPATALLLNLIAAGIGSIAFYRAGAFRGRLFWPFVITAVPLAFLGAALPLSEVWYKRLVGVVLVLAAGRLLMSAGAAAGASSRRPPLIAAMIWGAAIGFLSGMVGVGGGIFLSPLLILMRWGSPREVAAVSAPFIVANSLSALAGQLQRHGGTLPIDISDTLLFAGAVLIGGYAGSMMGSKRINTVWLRRLLAMVVVIAGVKMLVSA